MKLPTNTNVNSDAAPSLSNAVTHAGADYDAVMGRWSRAVARVFVDWLSPAPGLQWLDVGCGTGAITQAILEQAAPAGVAGIDPEREYVDRLIGTLPVDRARFSVGGAERLPVTPGGFDFVVSGLILNLVPDAAAALAEMRRVAKPDGTVAAYVWDFAEGMQMLRHLWDAAAPFDPAVRDIDQGAVFPLCHPDRLHALFAAAGYTAIEGRALDIPTTFRTFDDYWTPLLSGHGRAGGYVMSLTPDRRAALADRLRTTLPFAPDGSILLTARAWAIRGWAGPRDQYP